MALACSERTIVMMMWKTIIVKSRYKGAHCVHTALIYVGDNAILVDLSHVVYDVWGLHLARVEDVIQT